MTYAQPSGAPHLEGFYLQYCYFKIICLLTFFFHLQDAGECPNPASYEHRVSKFSLLSTPTP